MQPGDAWGTAQRSAGASGPFSYQDDNESCTPIPGRSGGQVVLERGTALWVDEAAIDANMWEQAARLWARL